MRVKDGSDHKKSRDDKVSRDWGSNTKMCSGNRSVTPITPQRMVPYGDLRDPRHSLYGEAAGSDRWNRERYIPHISQFLF